MIHSRQEKINRLFYPAAAILIGSGITFYVIRNFILFGNDKGPLASMLWMGLGAAFLLMLLLDKYHILLVYSLSIPFLLRLNITQFAFSVGTVQLHPFMISEIVLIAVLILKMMLNNNARIEKKSKGYEFMVWYALIITFAASIVSGLLSPFNYASDSFIPLISVLGQTIVPGLIMILIYHSVTERKQIFELLNILYLSFILNIIIGSIAFFQNITAVELFLKRMAFNFYGPNIYASVAQLFIPLGIYFIARNRGKVRIFYYVCFFILFVSLILTLSRGGIIACFIGIGAIAFLNKQLRLPLKRIAALLSLFLLSISGAIYNLFMRFSGILTRSRVTEFSTLIRTAAWESAWNGIIKYPLGIGGNRFPYLWSDIGRYPSQTVLHPHSFMLGMTLEYGIITAAAFIIFTVIILKQLFLLTRKGVSRVSKALATTLIASIGSYIIMGIVSEGPRCHLRQSGELFNDGLIFLYIILGIAMRFIVIENEKKKNTHHSSA